VTDLQFIADDAAIGIQQRLSGDVAAGGQVVRPDAAGSGRTV